ncbi:peptidoglycan-binding protein [Jiangella mangrovi]|uniref:Multidrug efflux pump subunit AcrA (Membrane-fusion protein) n=1 Tax=Jiangella mangrovi TaxID=1524084 RepID=A0A7W9GNI5_9ACTN|nr:peptidoglycan-binding protein [Jiangella mangrovi]MBB5786831.1 multidrug efflux pump subunit AcrA (membrane-fusion protein) [Jiangella mangrovi]
MSRSRSRTLLAVGGSAVIALGAGIYAGTRITSPADAVARTAAPEASEVTVPVELRTLNSEVVTRGDVTSAGAVDITPETGGLEMPPIVTGQVPEVGAEIAEGAALLEIVGRPLIALAGELPMYRSLRPGMSGPDVEQLEQTLERLGLDPGRVDDEYTGSTGNAVAELFERIGYEPPAPDPQAEQELDAANDQVDQAEDAVEDAEDALDSAGSAPEGAPVDEDALEEALDDARERLDEAETARDEAAVAAGTPLPAAEVVFVPSLPRRVDEVNVRRGGAIDGAVMSVSGASLVVTANVDDADHERLAVDQPVTVEVPTGEEVPGTITAIAEAEGEGASGWNVTVTPGELTPEQAEALRGANVRITVPIESTDGDVLAVPLAALTAGPGGESRVEVMREGVAELVEVEVGLTAEGYAEVSAVDGTLAEGDLVVVGDGGDDDGGDDDAAGG